LLPGRWFEDASAFMKRSDTTTAMTDAVARFEAEVRRLALDLVRSVIQQQLDRARWQQPALELVARQPRSKTKAKPARPALPKPTRRANRAPARPQDRDAAPRAGRQLDLGLEGELGRRDAPSEPQMALPLARPAEPAAAPAAPPAPSPSAAASTTTSTPPSPAPDSRKRKRWTRETIVAELATWMSSKGTVLDASFLTRHGPPGLVAATRRVFGRFDAAMNVAALHVSKLQPDGPPPPQGPQADRAAFDKLGG
jgi:hypothetical protein